MAKGSHTVTTCVVTVGVLVKFAQTLFSRTQPQYWNSHQTIKRLKFNEQRFVAITCSLTDLVVNKTYRKRVIDKPFRQ